MPPKKEKKFEINAKQFLLTWPQCSLSKEEVLTQLQAKYQISKYTVCEEKHTDGTPHVHAVLVLCTKLHCRDARCFDLVVAEGQTGHPNIKTLKSPTDVQSSHEYLLKDGVYITNISGSVGKRALLAQAIIDEGAITPKLIHSNPEIIFLNHSSVSAWLSVIKKPLKATPPALKRRHLWCTGPSNCGKTYWLRAYLSLCDNPFEIPTNNDFKGADETTDLLYFDEYRGNLTVQQLNRLCDGGTSLNTKGGSTRIAYPVVIICSNFTIREAYPCIEDKIYDTLINRFHEYDLSISRPRLPHFIIKS